MNGTATPGHHIPRIKLFHCLIIDPLNDHPAELDDSRNRLEEDMNAFLVTLEAHQVISVTVAPVAASMRVPLLVYYGAITYYL
jgi:hypothetical protein